MLGVDHDIIIFIRCMCIVYRCEGKSRRRGEGGGRQQARQDGERRETGFYVPNRSNFIYPLSVKTVNMAVNKYINVQRLMTPLRLKYSSFCDIS